MIPVLLSAVGIEHQIKTDLQDLDFSFAKPLLPHPLEQRWIEELYSLSEARNENGGN